MFKKRIRSPFQGKPRTRRLADKNGNESFFIQPFALTPFFAKCADVLAVIDAVMVAYIAFHYISKLPHAPDWWFLAALAVGYLSWPVFRWMARRALRRDTKIRMSTDLFEVRRWWGWQCYDRKLPHKFGLLPHDKAQKECEEHDLAIRKAAAKGEIITKTRYYAESFHLVFEYLGQRQDVMTVFGHKDAAAILTRLQACDAALDSNPGTGDGVPLHPDDEWDDQSGGIK